MPDCEVEQVVLNMQELLFHDREVSSIKCLGVTWKSMYNMVITSIVIDLSNFSMAD